ncbi:ATP-binding protein [Commensalibacter communis]|uniref:histidine kinase n=1 Tax=Commensalibacter communis TaxID=2972786 RepID=A0A9W4XCL6_9PROT|nr:ATP-binding protein [Commensalibacter communis]CAI3922610.1 K+-sensing histidine kinase KdpD (KdpD) (PDB:2KSF) [Commensalibacter communis]CAI3929993.1 K+-sensing histidine kinase KdpD (KdpD) (PDB:2KSF) [Commensalibacter communis]CAI3930579.1 K+-sensing histidine kinase KdpD (KdpD) (PDB:2KSF) [Commensalibacter communis]CAI3930912.1 K+-sensing histidine kinase KdpD (KdpD) (PDB:2KSF) [Commensalibacter communis]CAI3932253.1 K+-sensing histidine kinase KdpD (KdpD) (PDB:2KSF) [Commensalibacter co
MFANFKRYRRVSKEGKIAADRKVRRFLPRSLLARSLLMISIPLIITQAISLELFYGTFLNTVSRRLTDSVSGEISYIVQQYSTTKSEQYRATLLDQSQQYLQLNIKWFPNQNLHNQSNNGLVIGPVDELLDRGLADRLDIPFKTDWQSYTDQVIVSIQLKNGVLQFLVPKKKLTAGSVWLFVVWIVGSAIILFMITAVFAWVQFRAIRRLSKAVEKFGKGRDPGILMPVGSKELRNAAESFNVMRERILRFIKQRTVILASVSHDLRTPLTRLRLSLAMLPQKGIVNAEDQATDIAEMIGDTEEMEQMIAGYLSFARGEGTEEPQTTDMVQLTEDVVAAAYRLGTEFISANIPASLPDMMVRAGSLRRVLGNILENARRHGGKVAIEVQDRSRGILFIIDDDGPGIPEEKKESVFIPFQTGNSQKGTGLGLAIALNIVQGHGGDIELQNSPLGGLRVVIFIPK